MFREHFAIVYEHELAHEKVMYSVTFKGPSSLYNTSMEDMTSQSILFWWPFNLVYLCCIQKSIPKPDYNMSNKEISMYNMMIVQWNLSVTTTSVIKCITCDLFSNVF